MSYQSEIRHFNQGNKMTRTLKLHQGGIHAPGTYGDICTKCGSQQHTRVDCPKISKRERAILLELRVTISVEIEKP